ncbi:fumarylacetoacetate hydrolase family protein [Streptomyces sp. NPDC055025]
MRLATLRTAGGTAAVRVEGDSAVELGVPDVGALLAAPDWHRTAAEATGRRHELATADLAPLVTRPGKIICVGLNYRSHISEMGREIPRFPTLFTKFPEALIGPYDPITLDPASAAVDWEAELGMVMGRSVRRADEDSAAAAIAGFCVVNDITMRDWQYRTPQWFQGKSFEDSTPLGPYLVTPDELPGGVRPRLDFTCVVDGAVKQAANTADLVFDPVDLVRYISRIVTLNAGDVIATGTPGGVGHARKPPEFLWEGSTVTVEFEGLGQQVNSARGSGAAAP